MIKGIRKNGKSANERGFTLLEMLAVISVMVIMMGFIVINFKTGSESLALQRTAFRLSGDIRKMQSTAGIKNASCSNPSYKYATGVNFDKNTRPNSYILFSDCNGNKSYQPSDGDITGDVSIEKGVKICNIYEGASSVNISNLVFLPPDPFVFISGVRSSNALKIRLCLERDSSIFKDVVINSAGMIEIQ